MDRLTNTFKSLLKIAGKILFVIGLVLSIYLLCWGFWPPFVCIVITLAGAGLVILNKDADNEQLVHTDTHWFTKICNTIEASFKKTDARSIEKIVKYTLTTLVAIFILIIAAFSLSQGYFKKRDTINSCKEITTALNHYKESKKAYPDNLSELINHNPLLSKTDQWGNTYQYRTENNGGHFILASAGQDGKFNTGDDLIFKN
jgi:uncharacterized membrane protein